MRTVDRAMPSSYAINLVGTVQRSDLALTLRHARPSPRRRHVLVREDVTLAVALQPVDERPARVDHAFQGCHGPPGRVGPLAQAHGLTELLTRGACWISWFVNTSTVRPTPGDSRAWTIS
jgi:hypothetical protein